MPPHAAAPLLSVLLPASVIIAVAAADAAPAYFVTNADSATDGRYDQLPSTHCNGKPVYQQAGNDFVLFQPASSAYWAIGGAALAQSCAMQGHVFCQPPSAADPPDACKGKWRLADGSGIHDAPSLTVSTCPHCGAHGRLSPSSADGCQCLCEDGFGGEFCELAPAFAVAGSKWIPHNGRYERSPSRECNGKPVYLLVGGEPTVALFQPEGSPGWVIGEGDTCTGMLHGWPAKSSADCSSSPDGAGCKGKWQEQGFVGCPGASWCPVPTLAVSSCPLQQQCCGLDCGTGAPIPNATSGSCSCACSDGYVGATCRLPPSYTVAGSRGGILDGAFARIQSVQSNGKPVYSFGDLLLMQEDGDTRWTIVAENEDGPKLVAELAPADGACAASPDCRGPRWKEVDAHGNALATSLVVKPSVNPAPPRHANAAVLEMPSALGSKSAAVGLVGLAGVGLAAAFKRFRAPSGAAEDLAAPMV